MAPVLVSKDNLRVLPRGKVESMKMGILNCKQNGDIFHLCLGNRIQGERGFICHSRGSWSTDAGSSSFPALKEDADGDAARRSALSEYGSSSERFFPLKMKIFPFPEPAFASASQPVGSPGIEM